MAVFAFGAFVVIIVPGGRVVQGRERERNRARLRFLFPARLVCSPLTEVPERRVTGVIPA